MSYTERTVSEVPTTYRMKNNKLEVTVDLSEHGSFKQVKQYNNNLFIHCFKNKNNIHINITYGLDASFLKLDLHRWEIRNDILTIRVPVETSIIRRIL